MKKFLKILAGTVCIASVFLAGCENADGSCDVKWTLGFLTLALVSGLFLKHLVDDERGRQS